MPCCCNDVERIGFTEPMSIALRANTYVYTLTHPHAQRVGGEWWQFAFVITAYS